MTNVATLELCSRLSVKARCSRSERVREHPAQRRELLRRSGANYMTQLSQAEPVNRHRPSVDVLFRSAAEHAGAQAVAALLTGMGSDGARGMQALRAAGARTLAEHEDSCVVYGMPQAAIKLGVVDQVAPLEEMPRAILQALAQPLRA